jgi:hypothetical protein
MNENEDENQVNSLLSDLINRREDEDKISKEIMKKVLFNPTNQTIMASRYHKIMT